MPVPRLSHRAVVPLIERLGARHPLVRALALEPDRGSDLCAPVADALWDAAAGESGVLFALEVASKTRPSTYGLLTYLTAASATPMICLRSLCRHYGLLSRAATYELDASASRVALTSTLQPRERSPVAEVFSLAVVAGFLSSETADDVRPESVSLRPAAPAFDRRRSFERFFGAPVQWAAPRNTLVYARERMGLPMRGADPQLHELLGDQAARRGGEGSDWGTRVREVLFANSGPRRIGLCDAARMLGVSDRTLRRQLMAEGTSYQSIVDDVRRGWAESLLCDPEPTVAHVATAVGFGDVAAFRRAFRRWTGLGPRAFREQAMQPSA